MSRSVRLVAPLCALVCTVIALAGCGTAAPVADPKALEGVEWTLVGSSMSSIDLGSVGITANFDGKNIFGFSGVNQYSGSYAAKEDGSLQIGELAGTLMAGPEPAMRAEEAYVVLLKASDGYRINADTLTLLTDKAETLIYEKAKPVSLPGTSWNVTGYNNGKGAVTTPMEKSVITLQFGEDGTVSGGASVNRYQGAYEVDGLAIKIGPLALTKMAGEPALMEQEAAFVAALETSTTWAVVRGSLELRNEAGAAMVRADSAQ